MYETQTYPHFQNASGDTKKPRTKQYSLIITDGITNSTFSFSTTCKSYSQDLRRYINILNLFAPVRKNCRKLLGGVGECDCGWLRVTVLVLSHESRKWDFLARFRFVKVVSENDFVLRHQVHVEIILWVDEEEDGHVHLNRTDRSAFDVYKIIPKVII